MIHISYQVEGNLAFLFLHLFFSIILLRQVSIFPFSTEISFTNSEYRLIFGLLVYL